MKKIMFFAILSLMAIIPDKAKAQTAEDLDAKYATELLKAGTKAPDFTLKTPDGTPFSLKSLKGNIVVLDFWASWCRDCRKDTPKMTELMREFMPQGVKFVGVSFDTESEKWIDYINKNAMDCINVTELKKMNESKVAKKYGIKWIPSMYVIDKGGKVALSTVVVDKVRNKLMDMTAGMQPKKAEVEATSIKIDGSKGKLAAVLEKPVGNGKYPLAIICHGFTSNKEASLLTTIADSLLNHGIAALRFDFNGHGESDGDFQEMTVPNEIEDAKKVYEYVKTLPWVSKVAFIGHSQGGVVSAMTSGELKHPNVAAVALLAPAAVLRDDAIRGSAMGAFYDPLDPPEYVSLGRYKLGRDYIKTAFVLPIYETAAGYEGPAIIIHGNGDRVVPYTYGERFAQLWKGSEYVVPYYFDHGFSQNPRYIANLVATFMTDHLK